MADVRWQARRAYIWTTELNGTWFAGRRSADPIRLPSRAIHSGSEWQAFPIIRIPTVSSVSLNASSTCWAGIWIPNMIILDKTLPLSRVAGHAYPVPDQAGSSVPRAETSQTLTTTGSMCGTVHCLLNQPACLALDIVENHDFYLQIFYFWSWF